MPSFVRFIFFLLIAGSAIAFGIVLLADTVSERRQARDLQTEQDRFSDVINRFNGRLRHGDIAVEWQKTDASQQAMETSLLVRIYTLNDEGAEVPLPIVRVIIPHNRVSIDGLDLDFDVVFPEQYKALRNVRLAYFDEIYADGQPPEERFSLLTPGRVPRTTQVHPEHVTQYEVGLWQFLWDLIQNPRLAAKNGLKVNHIPPATAILQNGSVYSIFLGIEGVKIEKNEDTAILDSMRREAALQDADGTRKPAPP